MIVPLPRHLRARLLQLEEALRDAHLADAVAGFAGDGLVALGRAAAAAGVALHELGDVDLDGVAEHGLVEIELELVLEIGAAEHLRAAAAAAAAAEDVAEHLAEHFAEGVGARRTAAPAALALRVEARMAVLVVDGALVRFAENFVGLLGFLEFLFGVLVARIAIRVIFHRKTTIGLLDVGLGRGARQIEHLVVVAFRHSALENPPARTARTCSSVRTLSSCPSLLRTRRRPRRRCPCRRTRRRRAAPAPPPAARPRRAWAACACCAMLRRSRHERLGLLVDGRLVVALEHAAQIRQRGLDLGAFAAVDLVAEILERTSRPRAPADRRGCAPPPARGTSCLLRACASASLTMRLISSSDRPEAALISIFCSLPVVLSFAPHVQDAVGVDVEGHFDLRHAARLRRRCR